MEMFNVKVGFSRDERWFSLTVSLLFLVLLILQNYNGRFWMNDFKVFYLAAKAFVDGNPVYFQAFGLDSGHFKYSPLALLPFVPLSYLPYFYAKLVYYLVCTAFISLTIIASKRIWCVLSYSKSQQSIFILFITVIIAGGHLFREIHLGNMNLLLLFMLLITLWLARGNKEKAAGLLFAFVLLFKPHFIVLIPLFVLRRKWKMLVSMFLGLVTGFFISALFVGFAKDLSLYSEWFQTIITHNNHFFDQRDTIHIIFYNHFVKYFIAEPGIGYMATMITIIALLILVFVLWNIKNERLSVVKDVYKIDFTFEFLLIIALVPNLVLTDTEHFMFSIPLVVFILIYLFYSRDIKLIIISAVAFFFYLGNLGDLLGPASDVINDFGGLGIGNLLVIGLAIFIFVAKLKEKGMGITNA
jgi:hypothetical protein